MASSAYRRSPQRLRPELLVANVMREEVGVERARLRQRLLVARLQLANVLAIGKGIADAVAPTRDIFGLDVLPGGCGNDPLFGELA